MKKLSLLALAAVTLVACGDSKPTPEDYTTIETEIQNRILELEKSIAGKKARLESLGGEGTRKQKELDKLQEEIREKLNGTFSGRLYFLRIFSQRIHTPILCARIPARRSLSAFRFLKSGTMA